jgi:hypothetical protein
MSFYSFAEELHSILVMIVADPCLHSRWLNTLSYWENCGARKLAACEHPTKVKEEMLKHAAEEFRHAHYLKRQMHRLDVPFLDDYCLSSLLGGRDTWHYLQRLDIAICRLLKQKYKQDKELRALAYLLVTYVIECRAEEVYSLYDGILKQVKSPIRVHSILLEEKEHLAEIAEELFQWSPAHIACREACEYEATLFQKWLSSLKWQVYPIKKQFQN